MNIEDVVIIGGGPVGLFMGIALHHKGVPCTILEQRTDPVPDSRSLGIHPVSLELFEELGMVDLFLESGLKVKQGIAHSGKQQLGTISFEECPEPYKYILINPQSETERILRDHFMKIAPGQLITGAEATHIDQHEDLVHLRFKKEGVTHEVETGYIVGCDGKNSFTRREAGIHFSGKRYPDTYIMGDFDDSTDFGHDAVVYLPAGGLIECFPLPDNKRRWVVKTPEYIAEPTADMICELIQQRIDHTTDPSTNSMLSSFGVQHFMAERFVKDRILLAGDSAHVVSPIGGQGMNLGWLDAMYLANVMSYCRGISKDLPLADLFIYESRQKPVAKKVARRAEINMRLGRSSSIPWVKHQLVKGMLSGPFQNATAKLFTMRELDNWLI